MEVQLSSKSGKQVKVKASKALVLSSKSAKKQLLWSKLNVLDLKEDHHSLSKAEKLEKTSLCTELEKAALLEEISWRQKSKVLYLKEGDSNTRFFHRMANSNRRNNCIENLND